MTREPEKFQIQLASSETHWGSISPKSCARCGQEINITEDPEHVIIWPRRSEWAIKNEAADGHPMRFHLDPCFEEMMMGLVEFYKVFIIEKRKQRGKTN
jgi:hypothetical protein